MSNNIPKPWWQNSRGELFVITQLGLFILIIWGPVTLPFLQPWHPLVHDIAEISGMLLMITGTLLALAGSIHLGRNLTPFICPKTGSVLLDRGAFRLIRHPIYSGILQLSFGWGLWNHGLLTLSYTLLLFILFIFKSRREELILRQTFPGYAAYAARVRRLIPFIY